MAFLAMALYFLSGCAAIRSGGLTVETKYGRVSYELPTGFGK